MATPSPYRLWRQAEERFPDDPAARRIQYIWLMRQHGYIVPTIEKEKQNGESRSTRS